MECVLKINHISLFCTVAPRGHPGVCTVSKYNRSYLCFKKWSTVQYSAVCCISCSYIICFRATVVVNRKQEITYICHVMCWLCERSTEDWCSCHIWVISIILNVNYNQNQRIHICTVWYDHDILFSFFFDFISPAKS